MQDYKSLCAVVTICATLVNIQTHRHIDRQHFDQLIRTAQPAALKLLQHSTMEIFLLKQISQQSDSTRLQNTDVVAEI